MKVGGLLEYLLTVIVLQPSRASLRKLLCRIGGSLAKGCARGKPADGKGDRVVLTSEEAVLMMR